jgi:hypothetical protein
MSGSYISSIRRSDAWVTAVAGSSPVVGSAASIASVDDVDVDELESEDAAPPPEHAASTNVALAAMAVTTIQRERRGNFIALPLFCVLLLNLLLGNLAFGA